MSCTDECVNTGISQLQTILGKITRGALCHNPNIDCPLSQEIIIQLEAALFTFRCKLPKNIIETIKTQITLLSTEQSNTTSQVNIAYLVVIFITLLLLVIFNYVSQLTGLTLLFFILSIIIVIIAPVILYFWLQSIYNNSSENIKVIVEDIRILLNGIIEAGQESLCCLGCKLCRVCQL